ncbi:hypothetical protein BST81_17775 [Leptolyngbya sp. 'hensonii']|uniref:nucleotide exchange factor GrpE n=1 Tax=Leptolyngbya sp. 'hensonii' TaxID=1922337 RepID=UPI00094FF39B|nr:hypothetical protein [Leptolyngbya sp. 'hensonii']OLP17197.1 hypothetical protein BST81_17775 [Leptolyngbya sp. 'hensonii']
MFQSSAHVLLWFETLLLLGCLTALGLLLRRSSRSQPVISPPLPSPTAAPSPPPPSPVQSEVAALRQEGLRLRQELAHQEVTLTANLRRETFHQLQTLLTNYPSVRQMVQTKPDLPAKNILSLFNALETLVQHWGYEPIGMPWEQVSFDPQIHQPDSSGLAPGDPVYIRFVGYRDGDQILSPAKVSRTLPGGGA